MIFASAVVIPAIPALLSIFHSRVTAGSRQTGDLSGSRRRWIGGYCVENASQIGQGEHKRHMMKTVVSWRIHWKLDITLQFVPEVNDFICRLT